MLRNKLIKNYLTIEQRARAGLPGSGARHRILSAFSNSRT
jgi:hypothetical protein